MSAPQRPPQRPPVPQPPQPPSGPQPPAKPEHFWQRLARRWDYYGHGPRHALMIVVREARQYVRHWLSREVFIVACDRCGSLRKQRERNLPDDGQLLCPVCQMRTFHHRIYYDHEDERHRELGL